MMDRITYETFVNSLPAFDAQVLTTSAIDRFCSSSVWIIPAATTLMPERTPWIWHGDHGDVAMMRGVSSEGWSYVQPLEAVWCLACPLIGTDTVALCDEFAQACQRAPQDWDAMMLGGIVPSSPMYHAVYRSLSPYYHCADGPRVSRCVINLRDGVDGFLRRRSANFRHSVQQAKRHVQRAGIQFTTYVPRSADEARGLYQRIMQVESRSWKGMAQVGISVGEMRHFYAEMLVRLARTGNGRVLLAHHNDHDIGYLLGGVLGSEYRGLQFGFDAAYRSVGLGNMLQITQMIELCAQGMTLYDMGCDMPYKRRWADEIHETVMVLVTQPHLTLTWSEPDMDLDDP